MDSNEISSHLISYIRTELKDAEYSSGLEQLQGGYETATYRFMLKGVGDELSRRLVLRLYPPSYGTRNAIWESMVQNALAGEGFPVPKVHFVCTDMTILGGAFIVMDFIPGQQLLYASPHKMPEILGETHAALHLIDPGPLVKTLTEKGIDEYEYSLDSRYDWLRSIAGEIPWISDSVSWLIDNQPPEPERLAICHGDFHALNILVDEGKVTGVLDWPGFAIADPALDVANTLVLTTIPARRLILPTEDAASVDWNLVAEAYLAAYRARKPLDSTNLDYYQVSRCVMALIQGYGGQEVWRHPLIVDDLVGYIRTITGVAIKMPG